MATVPAILNTARLGNFRLGYESAALATIRRTKVRILLAGTDVRVRVAGLSIRKPINETPDTASLTIQSPAPTGSQALRITINNDAPRLLFAGTVQVDDQTYEGKPTQLAYPCTAIDDTGRVNKRRPVGTWVNISATTVAQELVASFAPGFSASGIAASLPLVTITFDGTTSFMGCLAQLATLIGGYCNAEDGVVSLFLTDTSDPPDPVDNAHAFLDSPPITVSRDDSQLATRVYGKGHAEAVPVDIAIGETILPLEDTVMYNPGGGKVIASTTPDGATSEILTYTGVILGGAGAIVGPGATPTAPPVIIPKIGAGIAAGTHSWAYTWVTAAGETLPSSLNTLTLAAMVAPAAAPVLTAAGGGATGHGLVIGDTLDYAISYGAAATAFDVTTETDRSPLLSRVLITSAFGAPFWNLVETWFYYSADPQVTYVHFWTRINGGSWRLCTDYSLPNYAAYAGSLQNAGVIDTFTFTVTALTPYTTPPGQAALSSIALGPAAVTSRKIYRTAAGSAQLKLQQTIANNTATVGVQDATADGSLGANAPTTDTSGLAQPAGQINAGSTSMLTAGTGTLPSSGWVITPAGDWVRFTGISGNTLTGIPASGVGSILTTVFYGDPVVPAPSLTGVTGVTKALMKGSLVHLWVQRDDTAAQAAAAARESTTTYTSDGIHEVTIVDERRGEASLVARCNAHLTLFANPIVTVTYATRDVKTKSGKPVTITLASPAISQTLIIQDVTITEIDVAIGLAPKFLVTASSIRFSLEDLLRRMNALLDS